MKGLQEAAVDPSTTAVKRKQIELEIYNLADKRAQLEMEDAKRLKGG